MVIATHSRASSTIRSFLQTVPLSFLCLLTACTSAANTPWRLQDALRTEQQTNHIVIGYEDEQQLRYVDTAAGNAFRQVSAPSVAPEPQRIELRGAIGVRTSPDGNWIASCTKGPTCVVREKADAERQFTVLRTRALTPLNLSQDDEFAFLIERAPNWRLPLRCSFEDERDLIIYNTVTGKRGTLITLCGGFPYGSLRWYQLSAP